MCKWATDVQSVCCIVLVLYLCRPSWNVLVCGVKMLHFQHIRISWTSFRRKALVSVFMKVLNWIFGTGSRSVSYGTVLLTLKWENWTVTVFPLKRLQWLTMNFGTDKMYVCICSIMFACSDCGSVWCVTGVAEMLAMEMKSTGMYVSRGLSFKQAEVSSSDCSGSQYTRSFHQ